MSTLKTGDLAAYNSHPYYNDKTSFKITAYAEYTPPIFNIIEAKIGKHDTETGQAIGQSIHCIYYNSKNGKLETKWINSDLINKIIPKKNIVFFEDIFFEEALTQKQIETSFRSIYLNKKVALKSLDVELEKIKSNRSPELGKLAENNHLEFLPPIMSVIAFRFPDEKKRFCEDTGRLRIDFKCKWYNSANKSFSEEFIPYQVLQIVKETSRLVPDKDIISDMVDVIDSNKLINYDLDNVFTLENIVPKTTIIRTILEPTDIYFKHYYYLFQSFDYISQQKKPEILNSTFTEKSDNEVFGADFPSYLDNYRRNVYDCKFKKNEYYFIQYKDQYDKITKRIIRVKDLIIYIGNVEDFIKKYELDWDNAEDIDFVNFDYTGNRDVIISLEGHTIKNNKIDIRKIIEDPNLDCFIVANCLLRKGKIRNFKLKNILSVKEIIDGNLLFEE